MSSVAKTRISYEYGSTPYKHDDSRGKWSSKWDFYLASIGHAFGIKNIAILPVLWLMGGAFTFIVCALLMFISTVPIYLIESSLGQFSSSGFLSIFRISPMFKGIGYVILILNISSVTYYSMLATYPLIFFFNSLTTNLPWMNCNNSWNTENCTTMFNKSLDNNYSTPAIEKHNSAPIEYFHRNILGYTDDVPDENYMVWKLVGYNFLAWILIYGCLHAGIESISKTTRYTVILALGIFFMIFIRILCLPGSFQGIDDKLITMELRFLPEVILGGPLLNFMTLGNGWGTISTMASFNSFKTDTIKYSFIIPFGLLALTFLSGMFLYATYGFLNFHADIYVEFYGFNELDIPFAIFPYFFGLLRASTLWAALYFLMLFLLELNASVIMMFSVLTALFDEYIWMRQYKRYISLGFCLVLFFGTILYATKSGIILFESLSYAAGASQMVICFLELMVVMWIYGRVRFQRDISFMIGRTITTCQFFILRFTTPIFVLFTFLFYLLSTYFSIYGESQSIYIIVLLMKVLPWIVVPSYIIYRLNIATGILPRRFQKCVQPTDWYPADSTDRHRYEEELGSSETSHQLLEADDSA